jgi:hypothetical protein
MEALEQDHACPSDPQSGGSGTLVDFDSAYEGVPPWDIGRPQKEFLRLVEDGEISGKVLDVGCGTGEFV